MVTASSKTFYGARVLRRLVLLIAVSIGALVVLLVVASEIPVARSSDSWFHGYFFGVYHSRIPALVSLEANQTETFLRNQDDGIIREATSVLELSNAAKSDATLSSGRISEEAVVNDSVSSNDTKADHSVSKVSAEGRSGKSDSGLDSLNSTVTGNNGAGLSSLKPRVLVAPSPLVPFDNSSKVDSGRCEIFNGKWIHDSSGPLYTSNSCPVLTQSQNCQGNGRPDKDYENWRWKPDQCDLPRFDAKRFLELMRGKTLAFVGDSVSRNQMESLMCILWQVETPKNRGSRQMHRWYFRSTSTTIIRIWSSWLAQYTSEPFESAPKGLAKIHLDQPDETFMKFLPRFDVLVLSTGHWYGKNSVYVLNNTIVGGLWKPKKAHKKIGNVEALGLAIETALIAIAMHPDYRGLTVLRTYSPDHYEGGAWNAGGSCTGETEPAKKLVWNSYTDAMHKKQVTGFKRAIKKAANASKFQLLDITEAFGYRHDGHPGPYRSPDPNKLTKRGKNGVPPPQDCLHWCMPGPVDTWNEMLLEIIQRELR